MKFKLHKIPMKRVAEWQLPACIVSCFSPYPLLIYDSYQRSLGRLENGRL